MAKLCAIDSKYVSDQEIELVMKERKWFSLSGDSMTVKDHRGNTHFKIDPSFFAKKERRELQDADGNTIACAQKVDGKWTLYSGDSYSPRSAVAEIMAEWMSSNNLKVKLFGDDQPAIEIDGDFKAKTWQVQKDQWLSDPVLAKIRRDSAKTEPDDPQTYFIWCESGVDLAFVVLLAMVVDEKAEDGAESD